MADWLDITESQTDPDAPLTSELAKAWTDNVVAAFEGATGAVRKKFNIDSYYGGGTNTVPIPDNYTGGVMNFSLSQANSSVNTLTIALSSDGSTFSAPANITNASTSSGRSGVAYIDFTTGVMVDMSSVPFSKTTTIAGAGSSVTHFRTEVTGSGTKNAAYIIEYNGGEV